jgi:hypothetical protein
MNEVKGTEEAVDADGCRVFPDGSDDGEGGRRVCVGDKAPSWPLCGVRPFLDLGVEERGFGCFTNVTEGKWGGRGGCGGVVDL